MLTVSNTHGTTNRSLPVRFHHQKPPSMDSFNSSPPIIPPPFHSLPPQFLDISNSTFKEKHERKEIEQEATNMRFIIVIKSILKVCLNRKI
jgi:hypothetical protein